MDPSTTPTITFVTGKRGARNAVIDSYRYTKNRHHKENTYYRCVEQTTCKARITLTAGALSSSLPTHYHPSQEATIAVLEVRNSIKKRSAETDLITKEIVADSLGALDFEGVANLNCKISSLSKMGRRAQQKANKTPPPPTSLRDIAIPPTYMTSLQGENLLIWGSGYTEEKLRGFRRLYILIIV
ncbi:hypothetical protein ACHWQZ_G011745 [Mnemiopsis leidyi]